MSKEAPRYWMTRLKKRTTADWFIRLTYQGSGPHWINLGTSSKGEAASRAVTFWCSLRSTGDWNAAKLAIGQAPSRMRASATVGDWIEAFTQSVQIDPKTAQVYAQCLRRIAAAVAGITREDFPRRDEWRAKVDTVPLSSLTTEALRSMIAKRLREAPREQLEEARRGINADLRNARNLFTPQRAKAIAIQLPSPPPFSEIEIAPHRPQRYHGAINVPLVIQAAMRELDTEGQKALVLFACAGLRKEEADKLLWEQVSLGGSPSIEIRATWCYRPKSASSHRRIALAPDVASFLGSAFSDEEFVLSGVRPQLNVAYRHYRARSTFDHLGRWLREKGVTGRQPLHALRKEFGSRVNEIAGLQAAMQALGHSDISVTSSTYIESRQQVTVGFD